MGYKVLTDELQVLEAIGEFHDPNDNFVGYDHVANLWYKDEVVPDSKVSPVIREALDDEDHPLHDYYEDKLEKVGGSKEQLDLVRRLGLPFDDYDSLDEDDVIAAFRVLSGPVIAAVKEYEAQHEARERILEYDAGRREAADDRLRGDSGLVSELQPAEEKELAEWETRTVTEDGVETLGEGYTGTGGPQRPLGAAKKAEESKSAKTGGAGSKRRGGRSKAPASSSDDTSGAPAGGDAGDGDK